MEGSYDGYETRRGMLCTLSRFNFPCSLDNQLPHGHPPATTGPQGLYCVVDETHQITFDRCIYYIVAGVLTEQFSSLLYCKGQENLVASRRN